MSRLCSYTVLDCVQLQKGLLPTSQRIVPREELLMQKNSQSALKV